VARTKPLTLGLRGECSTPELLPLFIEKQKHFDIFNFFLYFIIPDINGVDLIQTLDLRKMI
jgi:hypothetical protein